MRNVAIHLNRSPALAASITSILLSASAHAQQTDAGADRVVEEVIVLGRGETRQVQSITAQQMEHLPAGTSPLKAIENLPGVNFQSADPYGAYEWSTRIVVRGFNQNQLGFTLDGVPLGDMTYGNHNGLHVSRAIPSENVARVALSQGAGSLDIASTSNLGGAVEFFSDDPQDTFGMEFQQMFGTDEARRTYVRLDTGELGTGTRAYLTALDSNTDKWKGGGDQQQRMYNLKLVQPIGGATITGYYNYSDRAEIDYQDLSFDIIERRGWEWDNWYPDWQGAVGAAQACNATGQSDTVVCDDAYWNASGLREDNLGYLRLDLPIGESIDWATTAYLHQNEGQGLWGTPYVPTPGGAPLSIRTTEYDIDRKGALTAITWTLGRHEINAGAWIESIDFTQARRFYDEPSRESPTRDFEEFQSNPMVTQWEYDFDTDTVVFHLQDTIALTDSLRVNAGFRAVNTENTITTVVGTPKSGSIETDESFLPQVGINWAMTDEHEVFAAAAQNVRTFVGSNTSGPFSTTAAAFNSFRDTLEPETSTNYELGWRFRGFSIETVLTAYHVDFEDRQLGISQCVGILGCPSVIANVGSVKTNGVEAALSWRFADDFTWFTSAAWNQSEYDDNYTVADSNGNPVLIEAAGKQVVDAPEILAQSELAYDNGRVFARLDANYVDERYYTYLNNGSVDAYTLLNAGIGVRFADVGVVSELTVQADFTNVTDETYISTIGSNGFVNSDPSGTTQTLLRGAPRQAFLSVKAKF